jgi:hypothetical protein
MEPAVLEIDEAVEAGMLAELYGSSAEVSDVRFQCRDEKLWRRD